MVDEDELREELIGTAFEMMANGLSPGRSGNVSARAGDGILITPSGIPFDELEGEDIVFVGLDGTAASNSRKPSSETALHLAIYRDRPEAKAIVHCHSPAATALACGREPIPAFHYMVAIAGGTSIPLAPYATFGTDELAQSVAEALKGVRACLMANHGQIAFGANLEKALSLAEEVETLAQQYLEVLKIGRPNLLDDAEMQRVLERFKTYGQQPS